MPQFKQGDIIQYKKTRHVKWRVMRVYGDGRIDVEKVLEPQRKTINRPEGYYVRAE